jgi:hypothetical protein
MKFLCALPFSVHYRATEARSRHFKANEYYNSEIKITISNYRSILIISSSRRRDRRIGEPSVTRSGLALTKAREAEEYPRWKCDPIKNRQRWRRRRRRHFSNLGTCCEQDATAATERHRESEATARRVERDRKPGEPAGNLRDERWSGCEEAIRELFDR